jgi:lon-related putative ATP-dependent protease
MAESSTDGSPECPARLPPDRLRRPASLRLADTAAGAGQARIEPLMAYPRAAEAIRFGATTSARGFNVVAIGSPGAQIREVATSLLAAAARNRPAPPDWVYVNNFTTPHRPIALRLPRGRAPLLRRAMNGLVDDLRAALPAMFESEDYARRRSAIQDAFNTKASEAFNALGEKASARGMAILRTPMGFAVAPMKEGKVVPPEEFASWPEERQAAVRAVMAEIEEELEATLRALPRLEKARRDAIRALDQETAAVVVDQEIEEVRAAFVDLPGVLDYLAAVRADMMENLPLFHDAGREGDEHRPGAAAGVARERYDVNVLVTAEDGAAGAPVVEELHPTLGNLIGRIEHLSQFGVLVTNFRLIKPGALHRANGGTILIDLRALLSEPFSWAALKRALVQGRIVIEDVARIVGLGSTVTLEPDPIPLDVKVVLFGERMLYYLLAAFDPEFGAHFKVLADFDDEADRTPENEALLAGMIAEVLRREGALPLDSGAIGRVVEHAARLAGDGAKLTLLVERLRDVVIEAGQHAAASGRRMAGEEDVEHAVAAQRRRAARVQEGMQEAIRRGVALIDTEGARIGQVNGLSVITLAGESFGRPTRITATVRPGTGRIIDIEREVELGGPIHSKGVLILGGLLASRFSPAIPMSLHAQLVFEQSYGAVEGDSASAAEFCALVSALAEVPLRQDIAITGSLNQHGEVQAIGGVNEKIEGFFEVCAARGLTGTQGVIVPEANVQHLMLDRAVVEACAAGRFAVWPVRRVEQALALLADRPAGQRGADGLFPDGSVYRAAEDRLRRFAAWRRDWAKDERERAEREP